MAISELQHIKAPIASALDEFEKHFKQSMKSSVPLLDKITYYIVQRKGKQVRPMFVFLTAQCIGNINESTYRAASMIELLHTATLVHDDVVDDSYERRSFFSINALWKNKIAVLVGDYLLSQGLLLAVDNEEFDLLKIVSKAVKSMSEGELLQMEKARKLDINESVYFDIIKQKTASLISSACGAGASSATKDKEVVKQFELFGEYAGMAFQIKDDLFEYGEEAIGKPKGIDIKEKKMTLPLIYALNNASRSDKRKIINGIKRNSSDPKLIKFIINYVLESGGVQYAEKIMNDYHNKALECLTSLPHSAAKQSLIRLVNFIINRTK